MLNNSSNNYIQNTYDNYSFNPKRTKTTLIQKEQKLLSEIVLLGKK